MLHPRSITYVNYRRPGWGVCPTGYVVFQIQGKHAVYQMSHAGEGFGPIGVPVRISEIPNYTVKNRRFDMCWPISMDNSVIQQ